VSEFIFRFFSAFISASLARLLCLVSVVLLLLINLVEVTIFSFQDGNLGEKSWSCISATFFFFFLNDRGLTLIMALFGNP
jgi:hypothetical protein